MRTWARGSFVMGSSLLQTFWDLSSYDEGERIVAAKEILQLLEEQHRVGI